MAYLGHNRWVFGGNLGTNTPAPEEWSCTINTGNETASAIFEPTTIAAENAWDAWNSAFMAEITLVGAAVSLEYCKVGTVDSTGHIPGEVFRHDEHSQSGGTANQNPFQSCMAMSLRTGLRGPSRRGRFFLPTLAAETQITDGQVTDTVRTAAENALVEFIQAMNDVVGTGEYVVVASSKGYNTRVTDVAVGLVVDTQRRRRRSLEEAYGPGQLV